MSSRLWWLVVASACSPTQASPPASRVSIDPAPSEPLAEQVAPAVAPSCAIDPPRREQRQLDDVIVLGELAGKTWAIAKATDSGEALLVHLASDGELRQTTLPAFSALAAFEPPHRIHFLEYGKVSRWWSVDISDPDRPKPSAIAKAPELGFAPSTAVKAFAVAGKRALISVYRVEYTQPETTYRGETAIYDRASGARVGALHPFTTWQAGCHERRCVGLATGADDGAELATLDGRGVQRERLGKWDCLRVASWQEGDRLTLALADQRALRAIAIDLASGQRRESSQPALAGCRELRALELGPERGVLVDGKQFVGVNAAARLSEAVDFPARAHRTFALAPLPDGALLVDFDAHSSMIHTPTDSRGMRRYFRVWNFEGRAGLLRKTRGAWQLDSVSRLPRDGEEGEFSDAPSPSLLVNGHHAAVVVSGDGPAWVAHVAKPCE